MGSASVKALIKFLDELSSESAQSEYVSKSLGHPIYGPILVKSFSGLGLGPCLLIHIYRSVVDPQILRKDPIEQKRLATNFAAEFFAELKTLPNLPKPTVSETANLGPIMPENALRAGFQTFYMDPCHVAHNTAIKVTEFMDTYETKHSRYIAPYTSLVTSSMMGKSRLMKEISHYMPTVYICLRSENSSGYPKNTPHLPNWIQESTLKQTKRAHPIEDRDFLLPTVKFAVFFSSLMKILADWIKKIKPFEQFTLNQAADDFGWMWDFFAENDDNDQLAIFWIQVTKKVDAVLKTIGSGSEAEAYLKGPKFAEYANDAYVSLRNALSRYSADPDFIKKFTLLIMFDEAHILCEKSAMDGKCLINSTAYNELGERILPQVEESVYPFSILRDVRRGLQLMLKAKILNADLIRLFALFTDTTSRLADFQSVSVNDKSLRVVDLDPPGRLQFDPFYIFTSVDAHAIIANENCTSNIFEASKPERLLKFGRAAWYTLFTSKDKFKNEFYYKLPNLTELAGVKLLGLNRGQQWTNLFGDHRSSLTSAMKLKLLALLGPRLDITAGPWTIEAEDLVASHLAVVVNTDHERQFIRIGYPSEPIVAQAAAHHTAEIGWSLPLLALRDYVNSAVVSAGFRGELLTKVVCLMAADSTSKSSPACLTEWTYMRPVKVSTFLDELFMPPDNHSSFSDAIRKSNVSHHVDQTKLERFLDGYVFFNHFVRLQVKLSIEAITHAWNRGCALTATTNAVGFDHVIPVMLPQSGKNQNFGPLFGDWSKTQVQNATEQISFIMINSRNSKDQNPSAYKIYPQESNLSDADVFLRSGNVFMSLLQEFGPKKSDERYIMILPRKDTRSNITYSQLVVVVKGLDQPEQTYKVLADRHDGDSERHMIRNALEQIRTHHTYLDGLEENSAQATVMINTFNLSLYQPKAKNVQKSMQTWEEERKKYENWKINRERQVYRKRRISDSFYDDSDDEVMADVSDDVDSTDVMIQE